MESKRGAFGVGLATSMLTMWVRNPVTRTAVLPSAEAAGVSSPGSHASCYHHIKFKQDRGLASTSGLQSSHGWYT